MTFKKDNVNFSMCNLNMLQSNNRKETMFSNYKSFATVFLGLFFIS